MIGLRINKLSKYLKQIIFKYNMYFSWLIFNIYAYSCDTFQICFVFRVHINVKKIQLVDAECIFCIVSYSKSIIFSERRTLIRPTFLDNGRYAEYILSRRNNVISCKSRCACGESDRLLNYRCLATCCLIIALTPSRNTGRGVLFFFSFCEHLRNIPGRCCSEIAMCSVV